MAKALDITIEKGKTFKLVVRWEDENIIYKPIQSISKAAPAIVGCTGHGVPDGWPVAIVSVLGMKEINAASTPPKEKEYVKATSVDANTIELNTVNAAGYSTYTSGGYVQYYEPHDLTNVTARMKIKDKVGGTTLLTLDESNTRITIDNVDKTITLVVDAEDTEVLAFKKGVYDLEGVEEVVPEVVYALLAGSVTVTEEVTTTV